MQKQSFFVTCAGVFLAIGISAALLINAQTRQRSDNGGAAKSTVQAGDYTLSGDYPRVALWQPWDNRI